MPIQVEEYASSGTGYGWVSGSNLPSPNRDIITPITVSTIEEFDLYDGSRAVVHYGQEYNEREFNLTWAYQSGTALYDRIRNWVESGTGLRLTFSNERVVSGNFITINEEWRLGTRPDKQRYNIITVFKPCRADWLDSA